MSESMVLAQLIGQAAGEGADLATVRAIAEEAGDLGAARALARLGLEDAAAGKDMAELRELLALGWPKPAKLSGAPLDSVCSVSSPPSSPTLRTIGNRTRLVTST